RASDLTGVDFEMVGSIAGADFTMAQGLTPNSRGQLLRHPTNELDVWNGLTRNTTRRSLDAVA
ncbi:MAG: pentapeptide repeat-containing protein, partial [Cyanobacteria bacterium P01_H01_bin.105]